MEVMLSETEKLPNHENRVASTNDFRNHSLDLPPSSNPAGNIKRALILDESEEDEDFKDPDQSVNSSNTPAVRNMKAQILDESEDDEDFKDPDQSVESSNTPAVRNMKRALILDESEEDEDFKDPDQSVNSSNTPAVRNMKAQILDESEDDEDFKDPDQSVESSNTPAVRNMKRALILDESEEDEDFKDPDQSVNSSNTPAVRNMKAQILDESEDDEDFKDPDQSVESSNTPAVRNMKRALILDESEEDEDFKDPDQSVNSSNTPAVRNMKAQILDESEDDEDFKDPDQSVESSNMPSVRNMKAQILDESEDGDFKDPGQSVNSSNTPAVRNTKRLRILDDSDDDETGIPQNEIISNPTLDLPSSSKVTEKVKKSRILDESEDEDDVTFSNGLHLNQSQNPPSSSNFTGNAKRPRILDDSDLEDSDNENEVNSGQASSSNVGENEVTSSPFPGGNVDQEEEKDNKTEGNKMSSKGKIRDDFVLKPVTKQRKSENGKFSKLMQSRQSKLRKKKTKPEKENPLPKENECSDAIFSPEEDLPSMNLDTDIFDAEGTDDENEKPVEKSLKEFPSDIDSPVEDEDAGLKKSKKGKKDKKKRESKKARDQELMAIHSESQRLLRETSIKLPYHKPPKLSLTEFLESRKKPTLPLDIKPFRSDTNRILALKNSVSSQDEGTHRNEAPSDILICNPSVKLGDNQQNSLDTPIDLELSKSFSILHAKDETDALANGSSINDEAIISNLLNDSLSDENSLPSILDSDKAVSVLENSVNTTEKSITALEDSENQLENSLNAFVNVTNPLENSSANEFDTSLSITLDEEADKQYEPVSKLENSSNDDESNALKIILGENESGEFMQQHSTDDPSVDVHEMEPHQPDFEVLKKKAIDSVKFFTPRLSGHPNECIVFDLDEDSSPPTENNFDSFIQKFVNHTNSMHKKRLNQDVKLSIVSKDETDSTKLLHSEICVNVSGIEEEPEFEIPGIKYLKLKEKLLDEILKKKEAALIKKQELEELDNEIQPDMDEEEAELTDDSDSDHDIADNDIDNENGDIADTVDDNVDYDIHADDGDDDDDSVSISFSRKHKKNLFIHDEASVSEDDNQITNFSPAINDEPESRGSETSKASCESQVSFSSIFPKEKLSSQVEHQDRAITNSEPIEAEIDTNTQFIMPGNRSCTPNDDTKTNDHQDNHLILFQKELANKNNDSTLPDDSQPICTFSNIPDSTLPDDSQPICTFSNIPESLSQSSSKGFGSHPNVNGLLAGGSPTEGINDELLALCSGTFTGVNEGNVPRLAKELCFDTSPPDMADVLDVCSGTFSSRTLPIPENTADEDSEDSLPETSKHKMKSALSDLDDDSNPSLPDVPNNISCESDNEKVDDALSEEDGIFPENGIKEAVDFFEDEAELSGDDVGSDADEDMEDGEYEEDFIPDEELPSDEELRDQIGKVHLKHLLDDDKRELRLYQELYLEDGELHQDGPGRQRKFTWQNSNVDNFMGNDGSNSESEKDDGPEDEEKWRLERYERQKFLHEQQQDKDKQLENSPIKPKWNSSINVKILHKSKEPVVVAARNESDSTNVSVNSILKASSGSILARGEDFLNSLSKKFKVNESVGCRTTKHFVFRTISPKKVDEPTIATSTEKRPKKKQLHRMQTTKKRRSIFDLLDENNV